jgi:hypothetical protein
MASAIPVPAMISKAYTAKKSLKVSLKNPRFSRLFLKVLHRFGDVWATLSTPLSRSALRLVSQGEDFATNDLDCVWPRGAVTGVQFSYYGLFDGHGGQARNSIVADTI